MLSKTGFTLIEFLIVVALMGVMAGFAIPQYIGYSRRQTLKTAGEELVAHIEGARNKALSGLQGASETVTAYSVLYFPSENAVGTYQRLKSGGYESTAVAQLNLPSAIKVSWSTGDPTFVVPTGRLEGDEKTIVLCYDNVGKHEIMVSTAGVIRLGDRMDVGVCP